MYPTAKGGFASERDGKKKTETNKNSAGSREKKKSQRVFSVAVASSCSYGNNIVELHLLSKYAISKLGKRDG